MIKKIICPTDFSTVANNAVEYAAKLSSQFNAELQLLNVESFFPEEVIASGVSIGGKAASATEMLKDTCAEVKKAFNISCTYDVEVSNASLERAIAGKENENTLVVMGTNGVDDLYQYLFGTNTYHVIKNAKCPILVVPDNARYEIVKKIVFAWDYNSQDKLSLSQLSQFINIFNSETILLHISKKETDIGNDVFRALKDEILSNLKNESVIEFERIYSKDVPESINTCMKQSNANLLALTFYDRGLIGNIFHGTVAKELSETVAAGFPILVLHV